MTSNEQRAALQRKIWDIANDVRGAARAAAVAWVDEQEDATDLKGLGNYD